MEGLTLYLINSLTAALDSSSTHSFSRSVSAEHSDRRTVMHVPRLWIRIGMGTCHKETTESDSSTSLSPKKSVRPPTQSIQSCTYTHVQGGSLS